MKEKNTDNISFAVLKSTIISAFFVLIIVILLLAVIMYNTKGEFIKTIKQGISLSPAFYISTLFIIVISSLLYAPFSYGISFYFINSASSQGKINQIFYLFRSPVHLLKAVAIHSICRIVVSLMRIFILLLATIAECCIFIISIVLSGQNIFEYETGFFANVMYFITHNRFFIVLTVLEWMVVICFLFYVKIKYIMCKYVFICMPSVGIIEAVKIGRFALDDKTLKTAFVYIECLVTYVVTFVTFGKIKPVNSFSNYCMFMARRGIDDYYCMRNY